MKIKAFIRVFTLTCLFIIVFKTVVLSQNHTVVSGTVITNNSPLEYVTVVIYNVSDTNKIVSGSVTDSSGRFSFKDLSFSSYILKATIQGYLSQKKSFSIDPAHQNLTLPDIELLPDMKSLNRVVVTTQKNVLKKTTNGFIMSARSNITQATGTATDLLRNTPTVVVDEEGSITIKGKTPLILVNGRNSNLSATDRIPASSVENIEIINNPSAKYDADAEGGIINIILKKNMENGTNGSVALGGGYGAKGRISSAIIINHQKGKWNTGLAYDNRFANRTRKADAVPINFHLPDEYYLLQNRHDVRFEQTQNLKLNVDFTPDKSSAFSLEVIGNLEGEDNHETLVSLVEKQSGDFDYKNSRHSEEFVREKALQGALNYNKKFEDKRKYLSAAVTSSFNFDRENTGITTQSLDVSESKIGNPFLQRTHDYQNSNVNNFRVDFSGSLGEKGAMEMGYKGITRVTDADFQSLYYRGNEYVPNPLASNLFNFREQVHAAYLTYKSFVGAADAPKLKYDFGIRGEQVWNRGHAASNRLTFRNDYFHLFPSANIAFFLNHTDF